MLLYDGKREGQSAKLREGMREREKEKERKREKWEERKRENSSPGKEIICELY